MRALAVPIILALFTGCAYVSKAEYCKYWDKDGDGWPVGEDCDDLNPERYPYAADIRGDGCDSDCLETSDDADGDDWPDASDCAVDDPSIFPCAEDTDGDGIDSDCDGFDSPRTDDCPTRDPDFGSIESVSCASNPDLELNNSECTVADGAPEGGDDTGSSE